MQLWTPPPSPCEPVTFELLERATVNGQLRFAVKINIPRIFYEYGLFFGGRWWREDLSVWGYIDKNEFAAIAGTPTWFVNKNKAEHVLRMLQKSPPVPIVQRYLGG